MTFNKIILLIAMIWTVGRFFRIWRQVRSGAVVVPPLVAANFVFALSIVLVIIFGISPLHLLWLFPVSFVFGIVLLFFSFGTKLILGFLAMLTIGQEKVTIQLFYRPGAYF
ncbi:MAG: hypothetical protein ALAOOOJD_01992 [bacterium]|nr:hypothetical protein [bacterium]